MRHDKNVVKTDLVNVMEIDFVCQSKKNMQHFTEGEKYSVELE